MSMQSAKVPDTVSFFDDLGARVIVNRDAFAIVELRGGTHVIIREAEGEPREPGFDLMVDDVAAVRSDLVERGHQPSKIEHGRIHQSFRVEAPGGAKLTFTSSHVVGRV